MNCIEFESALEFSIETRLPLEHLAVNHILDCDRCRSEWEIRCQLDTAIDEWRSDVGIQAVADLTDQQLSSLANAMHPTIPPVDLCDLVLAELLEPAITYGVAKPNLTGHQLLPQRGLRTKSKGPDIQRRSGFLAVVAVAACLMLAVIFATNQADRDSAELVRVSPPSDIEKSATPTAPPTPLDVSQTLTAVLSDIRSEYREMASETTSVARDLVNALPQHVTVPFPASRDEVELTPTSGDVVRIWRPISSPVESALGFLWQAVPSEVPAG